MRPFIQIIILVAAFGCTTQESTVSNEISDTFFSLAEIQAAGKKYLAPLEYIQSSDGVALANRSYVPKDSKAVLVFFHGG